MRLGYLEAAEADLAANGARSSIAVHAVCRLGERLALEAELAGDRLEPVERELERGAISPTGAAEAVSIEARSILDIPSHEVVAAIERAYAQSRLRGPRPVDTDPVARAAGCLDTPERREHVRQWALARVDELERRLALLAAAMSDAVEASSRSAARDDPLWRGATRGVILQHEAWRLDGTHLSHEHALFGPSVF